MKTFAIPLLIIVAICIVFGLYVAAIMEGWGPFHIGDYQSNGQLGDSFGAFTALFTALAFGGLLLTLWFQRKALEQAKMDGQKQHFENILFRMLDIHNQIVRDIDLRISHTGQVIEIGRDCFHAYYDNVLKKLYASAEKETPTALPQEIIDRVYSEFLAAHRQNLGHYFRYLYNIFKFIKNTSMSACEKKIYSNIVRSQLSDYELLLLYYNCLSNAGRELFKPMCEEFSLFNNLPKELLLDTKHEHLYDAVAYA